MTRRPDPRRSRAVLVGTSRYSHPDLPEIESAAANLTDLRLLLTQGSGGSFTPEHCVIVSEPDSGPQIGGAVRIAAAQATDVLLVYYTGHGLLDSRGRLHLALTGSDPEQVRWTALSFETLREEILDSPAEIRVLILDCCFSGRAFEAMGAGSASVIGQVDVKGTYTIVSSAANATSFAPAGHRNTAFTAALLAAARSGAEPTLDELYRGIDRHLITHGHPRPQRRSVDSAGNLVLFRADSAGDRLRREAESGDAEAIRLWGVVQASRGELESAIQWWQQAASIEGTDEEWLLLVHIAKGIRGDYTDAELRSVLSTTFEWDMPIADGLIHGFRGELVEADNVLRPYASAADVDTFAIVLLAVVAILRGEFADAADLLNRAYEADDDEVVPLLVALAGRRPLTEFDDWLACYGADTGADSAFGVAFLVMLCGRVDKGLEWLTVASAYDDADSVPALVAGFVAAIRGDSTMAVERFRVAAGYADHQAMLLLAILHEDRGEFAEAAEWIHRASEAKNALIQNLPAAQEDGTSPIPVVQARDTNDSRYGQQPQYGQQPPYGQRVWGNPHDEPPPSTSEASAQWGAGSPVVPPWSDESPPPSQVW